MKQPFHVSPGFPSFSVFLLLTLLITPKNIYLPTLSSKLNFSCTSIQVTQHSTNWCRTALVHSIFIHARFIHRYAWPSILYFLWLRNSRNWHQRQCTNQLQRSSESSPMAFITQKNSQENIVVRLQANIVQHCLCSSSSVIVPETKIALSQHPVRCTMVPNLLLWQKRAHAAICVATYTQPTRMPSSPFTTANKFLDGT